MRKIAVAAFLTILALVMAGLYFSQINTPKAGQIVKTVWNRTGGLNPSDLGKELIVYLNGSAASNSKQTHNLTTILAEDKVEALFRAIDEANSVTLNPLYPADPSARDFFTYRLTVHYTSDTKTVQWVDVWAHSERPMPEGLKEIQSQITSIIMEIRP